MIEPFASTSWHRSATDDARHRAQRRRAVAEAIGRRTDDQAKRVDQMNWGGNSSADADRVHGDRDGPSAPG